MGSTLEEILINSLDVSSVSKTELASVCFRRMTGFLQQHRHRFLTVAADNGLTPAHLGALLSLEPQVGQPMRALAELWNCDASNVTWLVDRLEERHLVTREPLAADRRIKTVVLTPAGIELRAKVMEEVAEAPAPLLELSHSDLTALADILDRLGATEATHGKVLFHRDR
jgi:DNA-binding MarR family transcriptional regulator